MTRENVQRTALTLGIASILLSSALFAPLTQTASKFLTTEFPLLQIIFFRSLGQTVWMSLYFGTRHGFSVFRSARPATQLFRSFLLFVSSLFWIAGIAHVPLTTASAVTFTAPIFVVLLSIPLLGEHVGRHRWFAVLLGFIGALVVVRPSPDGIEPAMIYLLVAAILFALFQILTRKLAAVDSAGTTAVYTIIVSLVVSAILVPWHYVSPSPGDIVVWVAFATTGLLGGLRHFFVIKAYESAPASVISPFFYSELIGVTILGFLVFADVPDKWTMIGAIIIVSSGLYIAHRERVRAS